MTTYANSFFQDYLNFESTRSCRMLFKIIKKMLYPNETNWGEQRETLPTLLNTQWLVWSNSAFGQLVSYCLPHIIICGLNSSLN